MENLNLARPEIASRIETLDGQIGRCRILQREAEEQAATHAENAEHFTALRDEYKVVLEKLNPKRLEIS